MALLAATPFASYPSLRDRVVVVTGGASGIGRSITEHFVAQGARVGVIDFDAAAMESVRVALKDIHGTVADLRDIEALRAAVADIRAAFGPVSVLVNNAARDDRHAIADVTSEYWDE